MMCSIEGAGSSREMYPEAPENGIYIFDEDAVVGTDAIDALGLHAVSVWIWDYQQDWLLPVSWALQKESCGYLP